MLPEKNLRRDITILLGLVPGLADDTAVMRGQNAFFAVISRNSGYGGGDSSSRGSGLINKIILHHNFVVI